MAHAAMVIMVATAGPGCAASQALCGLRSVRALSTRCHMAQRRTRSVLEVCRVVKAMVESCGPGTSSVSMARFASAEELKAAVLATVAGLNRGIFGVQTARKVEVESLLQLVEAARESFPSPHRRLGQVLRLRQADVYDALRCICLSNPPYIPSENMAGLQAKVGRHEPWSALDGGEDGMRDLRVTCRGSSRALRSGGFFA